MIMSVQWNKIANGNSEEILHNAGVHALLLLLHVHTYQYIVHTLCHAT